ERQLAARHPGIVSRVRRRAVRHLHAGDGARGARAALAHVGSHRRRGPRRARGQSVPLHRLHAHLRVGVRGRPEAGVIPVLDGYQLVTPGSLGAALDDLAAHPGARPFAGGTDLMVVLEAGHLPPGRYVNLAACAELRGIARTPDGGLSIGALVTYTEIRRSPAIDDSFAMLKAAAAETGGVATQNRGTIGGNIANASPAADTPPVLLAHASTRPLSCCRPRAGGARLVQHCRGIARTPCRRSLTR